MGHIRYASDVGAPVDVAYAYASTPAFVPDWLYGVTGFVPLGTPDEGLGAAYSAKIRLLGGLLRSTVTCEITEFRRNAVIGYTLRGRVCGTVTLRFDPLGYERSVLTSEADYPPPRGVLGRLCRAPIEAATKSALRRTEARLRREIEAFHGTDLVGRIA
ncbi:SRPBCC family protein [Nocardia thailandica]|uniref:SRPBCC family protein n=1 Tax=Nocardia thailandica TaxID=257275 RepID=UPI0002DC2CC3|nr:SRPBCC family protein [Nocardia thailandica]